jgi:phage terminase large subunit-like protein
VVNDRLVISWDTAQKDREVNDYSAGIVALVKPNGFVFILDVIRERRSSDRDQDTRPHRRSA